MELVSYIQQRTSDQPMLVCLDGRSGCGKSTLASNLARQLDDAVVIIKDNFYVGGTLEQWQERTAEEKYDQCIDWQRLRTQALEPLLAGDSAAWQTFNWQTLVGLSDEYIYLKPAPVIILEGAYSTRPELLDLVDVSVLVQCDDRQRRQRLIHREGEEIMVDWHAVWDEAEEYYYGHVRTPEMFDTIIDTTR